MSRLRMIVLGAVAAVVVLVIAVALRSEGTYEVHAIFDDVRGLIDGGEVKAGGVEVGTVADIEFTADGYPEATLEIDSDFPLKQGAFANIRLASNIGAINRYVDLTQGEGPELEDGATLGPSRTDHPVDFDLAVSTLDPKTRAAAGELIANLDLATRGRGPDLAETFEHSSAALGETANLLAQVNADRAALTQLVQQGETVVSALAEDPASLGAAAERLAAVLDVSAARSDELSRTVEAIGPGLASARLTLERFTESIGNLRALVAAAGPAVAEIAPTTAALVPAVEALQPLAAEASRIAVTLPEQTAAMRSVVKTSKPIVARLPAIVGGMGPLLDNLRARAPDVVSFFSLFGDATSNYDANGHMIRSSAILIQTPRHPNIIDAASNSPGSIERPFDRLPGAAEGEAWDRYWETFIGGGKNPRSFLEDKDLAP